MDIEALRSFLAYVETGSFTRAARQINRTQSAFSAQMKKLEGELGAALFVKEGRNLSLSEAGLQLSVHATQLIALHDSAVNQLQGYQNKRSLKLGCPEDYNHSVLPKVVERLQSLAPMCSIQIFNEPSITLRRWLDEGKIDAAIITRSPDSEEGYWLASDQGVWIASPSFVENDNQPLPLVLFQADCKYHAAAIDGLTKQGREFQLLACCNSASAQNALVNAGLAVGAMGKLSVMKGMTILPTMPALPSVDIVLSVGVTPHPLLHSDVLQQDLLRNIMDYKE
ncbi:LysR family transcriptional regulator [Vibrio sp. ZSDZ65]|uniref:LysR family transcriptional regulator n=1 Tax=Vibrio qingdaonensis TaxID=2829491 RepID=A0A9X3CKM4_9VIBR|nr:LysR family transcriptional regulator [Vibrio qingdaonensis]MCW8345056.1 LysR family transcriptional regulator [Vibrio qingdaonensis]